MSTTAIFSENQMNRRSETWKPLDPLPLHVFILSALIMGTWHISFAIGAAFFNIISSELWNKLFISVPAVGTPIAAILTAYGLFKYSSGIFMSYHHDEEAYTKAL